MLLNFHQFGQPSGTFYFGQQYTEHQLYTNTSTSAQSDGNGFASFLLGLPDYGYQTEDITTAQSSSYIALYAQDDYKASKRLTLNFGLRWDVEIPRTERHNQLSYWNPSAPSPIAAAIAAKGISAATCPACASLKGAIQFVGQPGALYGRRQAPTQYKDFGPRFGASYAIDSKTVLRGGFGLVFAPSTLQAAGTSGDAGTEGFSGQTNYNFTHDNQLTINTTLDNPAKDGFNTPLGVAGGAATDIGSSIGNSFFSSFRNPYSLQTNANIQRSLPSTPSWR